ncbi:lysozyme-like [Colias croceus]|uniref:lysozyme-like n=1 Tax=Colias crocea TaxID=72248 RepID=UPI001E27BDB6|nr:lysozyme-like [Colias croceus]
MLRKAILIFGWTVLFSFLTGSTGVYLSNLSQECFNCLCYVSTNCDTSHECTGGYCGPFNISRVYWVDAGKVTLPDDDPERNHAWEDCARDFTCSKRIISGYLSKFGQDCNKDGVTNCFDFMMVNGNGGYSCHKPLNISVNGRRWLKRFDECKRSIPNFE